MMSSNEPGVEAFIQRWTASEGAERANSQLFLAELCDVLGVARPDPAGTDEHANAYVYERRVQFANGDGTQSEGRIDLYKRGCFVLESKQAVEQRQAGAPARRRGSRAVRETGGWDKAMQLARAQADDYVHALPADEGRPPFLVVVDVGHTLELYAEFTRTGGQYLPFPDPQHHRLKLADLADAATRELLRAVWTEPLSLDPSRRSAQVTREVSTRLADVARELEADGYDPTSVASFLMRCLFTMFAEDVGLLPEQGFADLLASLEATPEQFEPMVEDLWRAMKRGDFSVALRAKLLHFNGYLFEEAAALPLTAAQVTLLREAAAADWRQVDPSIFGSLLERALSPRERHKLGAHFTPRAYVERLVLPTVIEPLREEWDAVRAAALHLDEEGRRDRALAELRRFHQRLCEVTVLDPACGTGNFLYVTFEHLKRLEGEVLGVLTDLGEHQEALEHTGATVGPRQLLGIELNPRAAAIAELVLWIGYLQWHVRTRGKAIPPEPIIGGFHNVEVRDAVLTWDRTRPVLDEHGQPVTRWDGVSTKPHPVTGEEVPDETQRVLVEEYVNPRPATWPEAEFVVGNPPFVGNWRMRQLLGDGYAEAIRAGYPEVPDSCDYVMYWWHHAANLARAGRIRRFGLITTNSLRQTFSRRVLQHHMDAEPPLSLAFAIPDHPWVDAADGADVRIAMTVAALGCDTGMLQEVVGERIVGDGVVEVLLNRREGVVNPDLTIGSDISRAVPLQSNDKLVSRGVSLHGAGFILTPAQAGALGLGRVTGLERHIRHYRHGRDIAQNNRGLMVIDCDGLSEWEVRERFPDVYQWLSDRVKPEREQNKEPYRRDNWWLFGRRNTELRAALQGLPRFISTPETARRRFFVFLDESILPDNKLVNCGLDDAYHLGILSSRVHVCWALSAGGRLGVGNDPVYVKSRCFDPFPFPDATEPQRARIRDLGERLDAHRKRQQAEHPGLTLTDMYNVLDKLRAGEPLSAKERVIHEQGLVGILRELHDELDAAVAEAYGWPANLDDETILERLVALNAERAAEERRGLIRWLRPEFQNPAGAAAAPVPTQLGLDTGEPDVAAPAKRPWPERLPEQMQAVRAALEALAAPAEAETVARGFARGRITATFIQEVADRLDTLTALGQARALDDGRYLAG